MPDVGASTGDTGDVSQPQLDKAKSYHAKTLARNVEKQRMTQAAADAAAGLISYHADARDARTAAFACGTRPAAAKSAGWRRRTA